MITGGDKLQKYLSDLADKLHGDKKVSVGFMEGAVYPDGTSVPMVAAIQEFGAPAKGIPPRPYFRRMIAAKSKDWPKQIAAVLKNADYDVDLTLGRIGAGVAGDLQQSILSLQSPPLAQSTIDRKGFEKPLVDTGHMVNSVQYRVDGENAQSMPSVTK